MRQAHRQAIALARRQGALISSTEYPSALVAQCRSLPESGAGISPQAEIIKISDEELEFITGTTDLQEARAFLFTERTQLVLYTWR